jgi:AcrR family transcriptional regulator
MYYFGDRDRILVGTLLLSEENLAHRRARAVARAGDPSEAVEKVTRLYLPAGARDVRWTLWAQTIARPPADASTRALLRDAVDGWSDALGATISEGVGRGIFRSVDPGATAYRYCRLMDGLAMEVLLGAPGRSRSWAVDEAAAAFADLVPR